MNGYVIDSSGERVGIAKREPDGRIKVRLSVPRSSVSEPVKVVWDWLVPGLCEYPAVVIT